MSRGTMKFIPGSGYDHITRIMGVIYIETDSLSGEAEKEVLDYAMHCDKFNDDDDGIMYYSEQRQGSNVTCEIGGQYISIQTRVFLFVVGDLWGVTEERVRKDWRGLLSALEEKYEVYDSTVSIEDIKMEE